MTHGASVSSCVVWLLLVGAVGTDTRGGQHHVAAHLGGGGDLGHVGRHRSRLGRLLARGCPGGGSGFIARCGNDSPVVVTPKASHVDSPFFGTMRAKQRYRPAAKQ